MDGPDADPVFEFHHHQLRFVLYVLLHELLKNVERFSHVDQEDLVFPPVDQQFQLLEDISDRGPRRGLEPVESLWIFMQSEHQIQLGRSSPVHVDNVEDAVVLQSH